MMCVFTTTLEVAIAMYLSALESLGLLQPDVSTGTFLTMPFDARQVIASTTVNYFAASFDLALSRSVRSSEDLRCVLEAIGPVFGFPLPESEKLVLDALSVYVRLCDPKIESRLPATSARVGSPARDAFLQRLVAHISQAFERRASSEAASTSHRHVVLACCNGLASIAAMNEPVLSQDSPAWLSLIHTACAVLHAHEGAAIVPETRLASASLLFDLLLRSRTRDRAMWALAGDCCGRSRVSLSVTRAWHCVVTSLARALAGPLAREPIPTDIHIDWCDLPAEMRQHTIISGRSINEIMGALTLSLTLFGEAQQVLRVDSLHEITCGLADVAALFAGCTLWPSGVDGARRFELAAGTNADEATTAPSRIPAGPKTLTLATMLGNTLLLILKTLPSSPSNGVPSTDIATTAQRARIRAFSGACAIFLRRETIGMSPQELAAFVQASIDALEDSSLVIQGHALTDLLPAYAIITPDVYPTKLQTAALISSSSLMSPHLTEASPDKISVQRGGANRATVFVPPAEDNASFSAAPSSHNPAPLGSPRGPRPESQGSLALPPSTSEAQTSFAPEKVDVVVADDYNILPVVGPTALLTRFRFAACSHFANSGSARVTTEHAGIVLGALLRALTDFAADDEVLPALLSAAHHCLANFASLILREAPDATAGKAAGARFELAIALVEQVARQLTVQTDSLRTLPMVLFFLRELRLPWAPLFHAVVEAMGEFACSLRQNADAAGIANVIIAKRSNKDANDGITLDAPLSSRLFALTAKSIARLCARHQHVFDGAVPRFVERSEVLTPILQVVDAGMKGVTPEMLQFRDAAEELLNTMMLQRHWPYDDNLHDLSSRVSEVDFLSQARTIKAFGVSHSRVLTVMQCRADDPDDPDFLVVVLRNVAGRWAWKFEVNELARQAKVPADDVVSAALRTLADFPSTNTAPDILERSNLDAPRHEAIIRRWKADPPLAQALKSMEVAESAAARAAAADTREYPPVGPGLVSLPESGEHTALTRRLISDLGLITHRTRSLSVTGDFIGRLKALDFAAMCDCVDVPVLRYTAVGSQADDARGESDARLFEAFCDSLGTSVKAAAAPGKSVSRQPLIQLYAITVVIGATPPTMCRRPTSPLPMVLRMRSVLCGTRRPSVTTTPCSRRRSPASSAS
jgi:hypothetical protein